MSSITLEHSSEQDNQKISMKFVTLVSIVAALGGLLFGFDTAVVSGAIGFMEKRFNLNDFQTGWAVSSLIIGCIPGALFSGMLSDKFGRKKSSLRQRFFLSSDPLARPYRIRSAGLSSPG